MMKKDSIIFICLSVVASGLSYAIYPILARILPSPEYVGITIALSLLTQMTTFLSAIVAITIGLTKSDGINAQESSVHRLQRSLFVTFVVLAALFLFISPYVLKLIDTPTTFAFPVALMMVLSIPITILSGHLNGTGKMIKLGILTLLSAALQFLIGVVFASITNNGVMTMLSMTFAQIATVILAYKLFSKDNLPVLFDSIKVRESTHSRIVNRTYGYALLVSVVIMAVNVAQIADLMLVQTLEAANVKFYTDIYIISRVIFFAGMILIWPFLGSINVQNYRANLLPHG